MKSAYATLFCVIALLEGCALPPVRSVNAPVVETYSASPVYYSTPAPMVVTPAPAYVAPRRHVTHRRVVHHHRVVHRAHHHSHRKRH